MIKEILDMRRNYLNIIVCSLLFSVFCVAMQGQTYYVAPETNNVYIVNENSKQELLNSWTTIYDTTQVFIKDAGELIIVNPQTSRMYLFSKRGKYAIKDIIQDRSINNSSITLEYLKQSANNIKRSSNAISYRQGGTTRSLIEEIIASAILEYIHNDISSNPNLVIHNKDHSGYSTLQVKNLTANYLYINIIAFNSVNNNISLCYVDVEKTTPAIEKVSCICLPPDNNIIFQGTPFYINPSIKYFAFGSTEPFNSKKLEAIIMRLVCDGIDEYRENGNQHYEMVHFSNVISLCSD